MMQSGHGMFNAPGLGSGGPALQPSGVGFTIVDGAVTAMQRIFGTHTVNLPLPSGATFAVSGNTVTETLAGRNGTEVLQYTIDPSNASLYHLSAETATVSSPTTAYDNGRSFGYTFTISDGAVTGMQQFVGNATNSHSWNLSIDPSARFTVSGSTITETTVHGNAIETIQFVTSGTGGLYAVAQESTTFVQPGSATTLLCVQPYERAKFIFASNDTVTQVQLVRADGSLATVTVDGSTTFTKLAGGYVLETVSHGARSAFEVFHDGNGDGIYTAVAHGTGTSVDLVGLQAQITPAIDAIL